MKTRTLTRWHSRIGIFVCAWILLLATTGLALQHSHRIGLDSPVLTSKIWYQILGVPVPTIQSIDGVELWTVDRHLVSAQGVVGELSQQVANVLVGEEQVLLADGASLWLLLHSGELVDSIPLATDMVLAGVSRQGLPLLKDANGQLWQQDWWLEQPMQPVTTEVMPALVPFQAQEYQPKLAEGAGISVEQLLLELHSGRVFGVVGEWLMTAVALMAIAIACTGFVIWGRRKK